MKQQEAIRALAAQVWIKRGSANHRFAELLARTLASSRSTVSFCKQKEVFYLGKDTSKPIRYKTIQKNTKLAEFVVEEGADINSEEKPPAG